MANFGILCWLLCWFSWTLSAAAAQFESFSPQTGITYSVHIPNNTAVSDLGSIYFQINASLPLTWVALGQGTQMAGANIFVVYSNAAGDNVTVSPRLGKGYVQPLFNPHAKISVMEGSGIRNGVMAANVRCDSCLQWDGGSMKPTDPTSSWVWAVKNGDPLRSNSPSATITQHDSHGVQVVNLAKATGGNAKNPFADLSSSPVRTTSPSGSDGDSSGGEGDLNKKITAHAVLMIVIFVILFPFSALSLYLFPSFGVLRTHAPLQLSTLAIAIAGMGLGISIANDTHQLGQYHSIIGLVVVLALVAFQPAMGLWQHLYFRKTGGKSIFAYTHRWLGRSLIILGVINVGFGFQLAGIGDGAPVGAVIAYAVVAGVFALGYIVVVTIVVQRKKRHAPD